MSGHFNKWIKCESTRSKCSSAYDVLLVAVRRLECGHQAANSFGRRLKSGDQARSIAEISSFKMQQFFEEFSGISNAYFSYCLTH